MRPRRSSAASSVGEFPASKPGSAARVTLARQEGVREPRAQLLRFRHARHGQHPCGAAVDGAGQCRAGAEDVDDHGDATRGAGTRDVIEELNPHRRSARWPTVTMRARGMKLKSLAEAAV